MYSLHGTVAPFHEIPALPEDIFWSDGEEEDKARINKTGFHVCGRNRTTSAMKNSAMKNKNKTSSNFGSEAENKSRMLGPGPRKKKEDVLGLVSSEIKPRCSKIRKLPLRSGGRANGGAMGSSESAISSENEAGITVGMKRPRDESGGLRHESCDSSATCDVTPFESLGGTRDDATPGDSDAKGCPKGGAADWKGGAADAKDAIWRDAKATDPKERALAWPQRVREALRSAEPGKGSKSKWPGPFWLALPPRPACRSRVTKARQEFARRIPRILNISAEDVIRGNCSPQDVPFLCKKLQAATDAIRPRRLQESGLMWEAARSNVRGTYGECYVIRTDQGSFVAKLQRVADDDGPDQMRWLMEATMDAASTILYANGVSAALMPGAGHVEWLEAVVRGRSVVHSPGALCSLPQPTKQEAAALAKDMTHPLWCGNIPFQFSTPYGVSYGDTVSLLGRTLETPDPSDWVRNEVTCTLAAAANCRHKAQHTLVTMMPHVGSASLHEVYKRGASSEDVCIDAIAVGFAVAGMWQATGCWHNDLTTRNVMRSRLPAPVRYVWDVPHGRMMKRITAVLTHHVTVIDWGLAGTVRQYSHPDGKYALLYRISADDIDQFLLSAEADMEHGGRCTDLLRQLRGAWRNVTGQPWVPFVESAAAVSNASIALPEAARPTHSSPGAAAAQWAALFTPQLACTMPFDVTYVQRGAAIPDDCVYQTWDGLADAAEQVRGLTGWMDEVEAGTSCPVIGTKERADILARLRHVPRAQAPRYSNARYS